MAHPAEVHRERFRVAYDEVGGGMTELDEQEVRMELARLRQEHRDLDAAIGAMQALGTGDSIQIQRLKKRKLVLKDRITFLEDQIVPDIIA